VQSVTRWITATQNNRPILIQVSHIAYVRPCDWQQGNALIGIATGSDAVVELQVDESYLEVTQRILGD
jgi:hypothetical protein